MTVLLFHGTTSKAADRIMQTGILPGSFFTEDLATAQGYALRKAGKTNRPSTTAASGGLPVVLVFDVPDDFVIMEGYTKDGPVTLPGGTKWLWRLPVATVEKPAEELRDGGE